ncbi:hypothetical protein ASD65_14600 [Microbacterium sp. Root61]|uniref:choice-of-anchor D domain-containing protein n=1 Tax=Microbacterium sp. Root61 TaxID=1736570 RepID=UPI0006FB1121|nr:choice-of-anchor D domain-containing protein [Microbacterium sp. Root61]KRA25510.1 hypothetical protein ASD65_14600 [Microbacterium sp. Root61]
MGWASARRNAGSGRTKRWTAIAAVAMALVASAVVFTPQPTQAAGLLPVTPTSIDFGAVPVGETSEWVTLSFGDGNGGSVSLPQNVEYSSPSCSSTCTIRVRFAPTSPMILSGVIAISGFGLADGVTVPVTGIGTQAGITVTPSSVEFGTVVIGSSATRTATVANTGNIPVDLTRFHVSAPFVITGGTCVVGALAPGATCTIDVTFTPYAYIGYQYRLAIDTSQVGTVTASLSALGVVPSESFTIAPTATGFPDTLVGATSPTQSLTVTNTGNVPTTPTADRVSGPFSVASTTCRGALAPGATCVYSLIFSPTEVGAATGSVRVESGTGASATATLDGIAIAPQLVPSESTLDFGDVEVGKISRSASLKITNAGSAATPVTVTATGQFTADAAACAGSLAPGASCDVSVTYRPVVGGAASGTLTAVGGTSTTTVALEGTGQPLRVDVASLDLGVVPVGSSATATAMITNVSGAAVPVTVPQPDAPFSLSENCPATLPAHTSCEVTVTFDPTKAGAATSSLVVSSPLADDLTVALTGSAFDPIFLLGVTPPSSTFASTEVGQTSPTVPFVVKNNGNMPIVFDAVSANGDFSVESTTCTGTLVIGATCEVAATFAPTKAGDRTGTLSITSNAKTVTAELAGAGLAPKLEADPASVDFGDVVVNESSAPTVVKITNTGSAAAPVTVTATGRFTADAAACAASLAPGASCDVAVTYSPLAGGAASGTLTAVGGVSTTTVALEGNGLPLQIDVAALDLGAVAIGDTAAKTVTITNLSGTPVPVSVGLAAASARAAAPAGSPFGVETDCPESLPGGATCTATVTFAPTEIGAATARLAVTAVDAQEVLVDLTGEGEAAVVPPTPSPAPTTAALPATGLGPTTFGIAAGGAFALAGGFALFWMLRRRAGGSAQR